MRLSTIDDLRETLELHVMEMRDLGVASSSIRRYVNAALRADSEKGTTFLQKYWKRTESTSLPDGTGTAQTSPDDAETGFPTRRAQVAS